MKRLCRLPHPIQSNVKGYEKHESKNGRGDLKEGQDSRQNGCKENRDDEGVETGQFLSDQPQG